MCDFSEGHSHIAIQRPTGLRAYLFVKCIFICKFLGFLFQTYLICVSVCIAQIFQFMYFYLELPRFLFLSSNDSTSGNFRETKLSMLGFPNAFNN